MKQSFNKYKGHKVYNRKAPRAKNEPEIEEENTNQRKRSLKREEKEEEELEMAKDCSSSQMKNKQLNHRKSHVTFKNSNILDNRTSTRSQNEGRSKRDNDIFSKTVIANDVPPKIKRRRQQEDSEENLENKKRSDRSLKLKAMNESKSEVTKEFSLLREGNSKYSTLTESWATGSHLRKSFLNVKPILKRAKRISKNRETFDEKHFQNFKKNVDTNDLNVEEPLLEIKSARNKIPDKNIEWLLLIRTRGEKARQHKINKQRAENSDNKDQIQNQDKDKITTIPFPSLEMDEDFTNPQSKSELHEHQEFKGDSKNEGAENKFDEIHCPTIDIEEKSFSLVEKVHTHHKDISVPLVTEIQSVSVPVVTFEVPSESSVVQEVKEPEVKEQTIVTEIIENKNNVRTPAKVTNKLKSQADTQLVGTPGKSDGFKSPIPKRNKSAPATESPIKLKEVIHTFALRIDAKEILKEYDEIVLPSKLQLIFEFFSEIDNAINSCKRRGKIPFMSNIKPYVEQATNRSFDTEQFAKVLYVAPELYYYTWQQVPGTSIQELRIEIPENIEEILTTIGRKEYTVWVKYSPISEPMTNFLTNKRKILFRSRLVLYIEKLHKNFLASKGIKDYDFIKEKGWHPEYDKENIIDIPPKQLKNAPKNKKSESVSDYLKNKNIKNVMGKRTSETYSMDSSPDKLLNCSPSTQAGSQQYNSAEKSNYEKSTHGVISPSFYKKIESKERLYNEEKKILELESWKNANKRKQELMLKIAHAVKNVFSVKGKVSILFLNHILKYLNDSQRGNFYDKKELFRTIKEISEIVPEWLELKEHERGFLVKIHSKVKLVTIRNKILSHTE